jgi:hypothetical protein
VSGSQSPDNSTALRWPLKQELLQLADICDKVAINIEDRMTAG